MKQCQTKLVVIGMGFLMQYITPCYQRLIMKENGKAQILGTTAEEDPEKIKAASQKVGFPIQQGCNLEALKIVCPDVILFALPTVLAESVAREEVAPYYEQLRKEGKVLPDFYAFTPKPVGSDYAKILGEDIAIANIIPNMFAKIGDRDVTQEGRTLVALAEGCTFWNVEKKERLEDFFEPLGPIAFLSPKQQPTILASFSTGRIITDIMFDTSEILGLPVERLASCARAYFSRQFDFIAPVTEGYSDIDMTSVPDSYQSICKAISLGWIEGILHGLEKEGITKEQIEETTFPLYDLRIHMLQLIERKEVERDMRKHASRGGVFERACMTYTREVSRTLREFLRKVVTSSLEEKSYEEFQKELSNRAESLFRTVLSHSKTLDQEEEMAELRPEHHAALFGFLAKRCIQRFGKEGEKAVLECASHYGEERGHRMALRCMKNGEPQDMNHYLVYGEWRAIPGEADNRVYSYEPEYITYSYKCPWCEGWKKNDLLEYGKLYCLAVDHGVVRGFCPDLTIKIQRLQSMGDSVCEFEWTGAKVHSDEEKKKIDKRKQELTATCSKDFRYHTGHLYKVFAVCLAKRFGEAGEEICEEALFDYRRTYGTRYEFPLKGDYESID